MDCGRESDSDIGKRWALKGGYSFDRELSWDPERKGREGEGGRERRNQRKGIAFNIC